MTKSNLAGEIEQRMHVIRYDNVKTFTNEEVIAHIQSIIDKYKAPNLQEDSTQPFNYVGNCRIQCATKSNNHGGML